MTITIRQSGQSLEIQPAAQLREVLTTQRLLAVSNMDGCPIVQEIPECLGFAHPFDPERMEIPAGLKEPLFNWLRSRNVPFNFTPDPSIGRPFPAPVDEYERGVGNSERLLQWVGTTERGWLPFDPQITKIADVVATIARAWPEAMIAVTGGTEDVVKRLRSDLRPKLPPECFEWRKLECGGSLPPRVMVEPCIDFAFVGLGHRDIVIFLDPMFAFSPMGTSALFSAERARLFSFVPLDRQFAPRDLARVNSVFGQRRFVSAPTGFLFLEASVFGRKIKIAPQVTVSDHGEQLKRLGIWKNRILNRHASQLSAQLARGDFSEVTFTACPNFDQRPGPHKIVVLVENVEHAIEIARELPGAGLACGPGVWLDGLSASDLRTYANAINQCDTAIRIVTHAAMSFVNWAAVSAVVRIDGCPGVPAFPQFVPVSSEGQQVAHLIIVDFTVKRHQQFREWQRLRWAAYSKRRWNV